MPCADVERLVSRWLSLDLDSWTRRVLRRHFNPGTGSPYWLRTAPSLPFDPLSITTYEQLALFGPFQLPVLRELDPAELVPLAVPRPLNGKVWESGGTTGDPCRVFYTESMIFHRGAWRQWSMMQYGFKPGRAWLQATPSGPHIIGNGIAELPGFTARVYGIDMDPRWVKRLLREGRLREANEYTDHLLEQIGHILRSQHIDYISTTPALFSALMQEFPTLVARLDGAWLSGTQVTQQMYRKFLSALDGGCCGITYGNTFGNSVGLTPEDKGAILPYVSCYPHLTVDVVRPDDWTQHAERGTFGQVVMTVLHDDLFLPNVLERDEALPFPCGGRWPRDGIANVRPLQSARHGPEGVY